MDAAGDTGESEPALTIEDVLATFPADRIVVFTHPDLDCREKADAEELKERFGVPVTHATFSR